MRKNDKKQRIQEPLQTQKINQDSSQWQLRESLDFSTEYCPMLVEHCSEGFSFQSFAALINVMPELLEEWTEKYPEFAKARTAAALKQKIFWEKKALKACSEKFSISIFRYFTGNKTENPDAPESVVILPEEETSKKENSQEE